MMSDIWDLADGYPPTVNIPAESLQAGDEFWGDEGIPAETPGTYRINYGSRRVYTITEDAEINEPGGTVSVRITWHDGARDVRHWDLGRMLIVRRS